MLRERKAALTLRWKGREAGADCCLLGKRSAFGRRRRLSLDSRGIN